MIGFDADDTLWHTEIHYRQAHEEFEKILSSWGEAEQIREITDQFIIENLPNYGYGIKPFILSLIEAAIHISRGEIHADQIDEILSIGKKLVATEVILRPFVFETLQTLVPLYPLMLITKGDLLDQTSKVKRSGIEDCFSMIEVVNEKSPETYTRILEKYQINPNNFLMVGNTLRSDVHPVLALGGTAVHIPADLTWEHEMVPNFDATHDKYFELEHMGQLFDLITQIETAD